MSRPPVDGPKGPEIRHDVRIGVSLIAPYPQYPGHRHPPEEIYVVLSGGQWRQASNPWHEPGIGGLVYNPPNIVHAMRAAEWPLLALWFLWTGASERTDATNLLARRDAALGAGPPLFYEVPLQIVRAKASTCSMPMDP